MSISNNFAKFSRFIADSTGHPRAFSLAIGSVIVWLLTGPYFAYSDTWQLVVNTGSSIITFLMVFLIQNTQNRDSAALQIKLDELIRSHAGAHNVLLDLEELTQEQIDNIRTKYENLATLARADLKQGKTDTLTAEI